MGVVLVLVLVVCCFEWVFGVGVYGVIFCYDGWNIFVVVCLLFLLLWFKCFNIGCDCMFMEELLYGLCDECLCVQVSVVMLFGDSVVVGFLGNFWYVLVEMCVLSNWICCYLYQVIVLCLVMYVCEDDVVSMGNVELVMLWVSGLKELVVLEDSYYMIMIDCECCEVICCSVCFFIGIGECSGVFKVVV